MDPLSEAPYYTLESQPNYNFELLWINCVALTGLIYKTDIRKVHQLIHGFMQSETAETCIKLKESIQDGQLGYLDLMDH